MKYARLIFIVVMAAIFCTGCAVRNSANESVHDFYRVGGPLGVWRGWAYTSTGWFKGDLGLVIRYDVLGKERKGDFKVVERFLEIKELLQKMGWKQAKTPVLEKEIDIFLNSYSFTLQSSEATVMTCTARPKTGMFKQYSVSDRAKLLDQLGLSKQFGMEIIPLDSPGYLDKFIATLRNFEKAFGGKSVEELLK